MNNWTVKFIFHTVYQKVNFIIDDVDNVTTRIK